MLSESIGAVTAMTTDRHQSERRPLALEPAIKETLYYQWMALQTLLA